jgi:type II secretion system protein N
MSNLRKWFIYFTFITAALVFLIYYLFPSEIVKKYISFRVNQTHPEVHVVIGHVYPAFPPGLRFDSVSFEYAGNRILEAEQVRVVPGLASLLTARTILLFSFNAHAGRVVGKASITATDKIGRFDIEAVITGMQLADIPIIKKQSEFKLSGVFGLELNYQNGSEIGNALRARVELSDIELRSEILSLNQGSMAFERIDALLSMHDRRLELESCNFTGDQYDGTLSGFGVLKNPIHESTMAFSGRLNLHHPILAQMEGNLPSEWLKELKSKTEDMSIFIGGSIQNPTFSFE